MTSGRPIPDGEIYTALVAAAEDERDASGGWHPAVLAAGAPFSVSKARRRLDTLCERGAVVCVQGFGPKAPRTSYLPADHPDAPADDDGDDGRVWIP